MRRVTLENRETRETQMRKHVEDVANAILDTAGDAIFQQYLNIKSNIHRYSIGNLMLQMWQAPDSRLVASRTAFGNMAKAQGHTGKSKTSKKGKSWQEFVFVAAGSRAVWIWGAPRVTTYNAKVTNPDGTVTEEPRSFPKFYPADTYCVESIRYTDTDEPFVIPTFTVSVEDLDLYDATLAFAASKGIEVSEQNLWGPEGVSKGGAIATQKGTTWQEKLPTLLHEVAHELLHPLQERKDLPKEVKEHEGEATAAVILMHFGHNVAPQAAYLRQWKAEPKDVIASMDRISKAASEVVDFVEKANAVTRVALGADYTPEPAQTAITVPQAA